MIKICPVDSFTENTSVTFDKTRELKRNENNPFCPISASVAERVRIGVFTA
jgi:hypothetical protein